MPGVDSEYFTGVFTNLIGPHDGWSTCCTIPRAMVCSWLSVAWTSLMAAYGIPHPSRMLSHSAVVFCFVSLSISPSKVSRFCTLRAFVLNLSSSIHAGLPILVHRTPYKRSLPPPSRISPSEVLKALYGTIDATMYQCQTRCYCQTELTMRSPPPSRILLATNESRARNVCERRGLTVAERYIDMLSLPRLYSAE
jgi:hypothetical protein